MILSSYNNNSRRNTTRQYCCHSSSISLPRGQRILPVMSSLVLLLFMIKMPSIQCVSYMLLTHSGTKCVTVDTVPRTKLYLDYHAPDMVLLDEEKKAAASTGDEVYDRIARSRRQAEMKDMSVVISSRSSTKVMTMANPDPKKAAQEAARVSAREPPRQLRSNLMTRNGTLEFYTGSDEQLGGGPIDICIRSLYASRNTPSRFSLRVRDEYISDDELLPKEEQDKLTRQKFLQLQEEEEFASEQFSRLNEEMKKIENLIMKFKSEADSNRKIQFELFDKTTNMRRATRFWPIVRIFLVLLAGVFQARYIINFFKQRHIY